MSKMYKEMQDRIKICMKEGNSSERDILRTLVGEIQSKAIRSGKEITNEDVEKTLVSFKENALECIKYAHQDDSSEAVDALDSNHEIAIYDNYLPKYETVEAIVQILDPIAERLRSAKADGPATGMAMGILKKGDKKVQGKDVAAAVKVIRS